MQGRSLRNAALMLVGALAFVQVLVTVLESQARPAAVDPAFLSQIEQAQQGAASRYPALPSRGSRN